MGSRDNTELTLNPLPQLVIDLRGTCPKYPNITRAQYFGVLWSLDPAKCLVPSACTQFPWRREHGGSGLQKACAVSDIVFIKFLHTNPGLYCVWRAVRDGSFNEHAHPFLAFLLSDPSFVKELQGFRVPICKTMCIFNKLGSTEINCLFLLNPTLNDICMVIK